MFSESRLVKIKVPRMPAKQSKRPSRAAELTWADSESSEECDVSDSEMDDVPESNEARHVLDPEGEVILVLSNPNAPFASFDSSQAPASAVKIPDMGKYESWVVPSSAEASRAAEPGTLPRPKQLEPSKQSPDEIRFRLSSRHLTNASTRFRAHLKEPCNDTSKDGEIILRAQDWNEEALLIVLQIAHGQSNKVPHEVSLELMAQIAAVVDYYALHDACWFYSQVWISRSDFQEAVQAGSGRDLVLSLYISFVFTRPTMFSVVSRWVAQSARGPLNRLGLPMPAVLIDSVDRARREFLKATAQGFRHALSTFEGLATCKVPACSIMHTGTLLSELRLKGLDLDKIEQGASGYSVDDIRMAVKQLRRPSVFVETYNPSVGKRHNCDRDKALKVEVEHIQYKDLHLSGLKGIEQGTSIREGPFWVTSMQRKSGT